MEVPAPYKNAGIANLAGGILNILGGVSLLLSTMCLGVWFLVGIGAGAYQAYIGWQMFQGQPIPNGKMGAIVGIVGALFGWNPLALLCGIGGFVLVGNDEVKGWLESNGIAV